MSITYNIKDTKEFLNTVRKLQEEDVINIATKIVIDLTSYFAEGNPTIRIPDMDMKSFFV